MGRYKGLGGKLRMFLAGCYGSFQGGYWVLIDPTVIHMPWESISLERLDCHIGIVIESFGAGDFVGMVIGYDFIVTRNPAHICTAIIITLCAVLEVHFVF